ncbi:hypothetical protein NXW11_24545 [Bacteroides thetaiotaomicron]|uniref:hypothetical protein n=1 Tax=Bacteroides thetaiotaomicron TaxID=818 RepID=UPI002165CD97|nr:hypothetical protein [Bacteroides thetaiotaomicron]MCS2621059.1 hypothetical protein [Bacteroides thetaiotaomicron]
MYEYVRQVNEGLNKLKVRLIRSDGTGTGWKRIPALLQTILYTDLVKRYMEVII